jgi:hypothetical protein
MTSSIPPGSLRSPNLDAAPHPPRCRMRHNSFTIDDGDSAPSWRLASTAVRRRLRRTLAWTAHALTLSPVLSRQHPPAVVFCGCSLAQPSAGLSGMGMTTRRLTTRVRRARRSPASRRRRASKRRGSTMLSTPMRCHPACRSRWLPRVRDGAAFGSTTAGRRRLASPARPVSPASAMAAARSAVSAVLATTVQAAAAARVPAWTARHVASRVVYSARIRRRSARAPRSARRASTARSAVGGFSASHSVKARRRLRR